MKAYLITFDSTEKQLTPTDPRPFLIEPFFTVDTVDVLEEYHVSKELTEDNVMRFALLKHISERDIALLAAPCTIQTAHVASVKEVEIHGGDDGPIE